MEYYTFDINNSVTFMVGGIFSAQKGWQHSARYHHGDYELILCTKGPLYIKVQNTEYTLNTNDVLFVPPYQLMIGTKPSPADIEFYWLHFILPKNTTTFNNMTLGSLPVDTQQPNVCVIPQQFRLNNIDHFIVFIHQLLNSNLQNVYDRKTANCLSTIILTEISKSIFNQLSEKTSNVERIDRLKEWIRVNLYKSPTVLDMAEEIQLNPQYLSKLFKKVTGIPPKQYLLQLKIQTAQSLLIRTNLSIKEIATNSYFENEKLFMRQFKQVCGMTPSKYRAQFDEIYHNNQIISPVLPIPEEISRHLNDIPDFGKIPDN
ncbi:AraC family transcriptional regulator [Weissella paramesenteroides]|uniref:AraC family transcriptional regulator n=1 Tax=Weissella paramesenteroides TaxID=1249 RepID=UPI00207385CE|nr:AraC family transcriptional regulator [Weissella paramesenteroides]MCM6764678.1 AraC family transcriptional regulator [Weissella paramesenteroides]MCM6768212.1 AraC family transcriptional regulator [Weissella paramesenteroides]MCM6770615.1 AraC family transcriptional regulator [Weissella paramesenteroides]MCM6780538.1 AraC family transcriptional regulator [Weissella paramesenteroides]MCM6782738.1 AraC family transcriptional regulator [Weissella paramesenteroides]